MCVYPFRIKEHTFPGQHIREYAHATANAQEDVLHLVVKQYIPLNNPHPKDGDVTIIGSHANGLPKELYEPLWEDLLVHMNAAGLSIRSIWIADVAHQGASGVFNEKKLGNDPSWFDHSRDLNQLINHFRHEMPRPLIGIGHSMGAASLVALSAFHPRLLTTLILIDPTVLHSVPFNAIFPAAAGSARRRTEWPTRAAAEATFRKSPFYGSWDPRVLARWLQHGLCEMQPGAERVVLATTRDQEVATYLRAVPASAPAPDVHPESTIPGTGLYRAEPRRLFGMLSALRPAVLYVFGAESAYSTPELRADKMRVTGVEYGGSRAGGVDNGAVREVCLQGHGHMVPFEAPGETARVSADWLVSVMRAWREQEEQEAQGWRDLSGVEKRSLGQGFRELLAEGMARNKAGGAKGKL